MNEKIEQMNLSDSQKHFYDLKLNEVNQAKAIATTDGERKLCEKVYGLYIEQARIVAKNMALKKKVHELNTTRDKRLLSKPNMQSWSTAIGTMISCYRTIDKHFWEYIRDTLKHNNETQKQGQVRKLQSELEKLVG